MKSASDMDTVELPPLRPLGATDFPLDARRVQVDLAGLSHPGRVRSTNQDHFLIARFGRILETVMTNLPADKLPGRAESVGYGMLVADGLGDARAGEVASSTAISTLFALCTQTPDWIFSTGEQETAVVMQRMEERFRQIDATLRSQGNADPKLAGMATTMTLVASLGPRLVVGHVGDSRCYLFRGQDLHQLTRDHTLVQAMVDTGRLTTEQAAAHPLRNVLTRSLGAGDDVLESEFQRAWLVDGDQLLLCTDGLTRMVDDSTIAAILAKAPTASEACQELVAEALKNGGKDNVTVALARYRFPEATT